MGRTKNYFSTNKHQLYMGVQSAESRLLQQGTHFTLNRSEAKNRQNQSVIRNTKANFAKNPAKLVNKRSNQSKLQFPVKRTFGQRFYGQFDKPKQPENLKHNNIEISADKAIWKQFEKHVNQEKPQPFGGKSNIWT